MIDREKITADWIKKVAKENNNADKILIEKVIFAFLLLEGLVKQKLHFVFKGGTALMLHLNSSKRLSIDIDIIIPGNPDNLDELLDTAAIKQGFLRKEMHSRKITSKIKKAHYKFYYTPLHNTNKTEDYVLLDILFEEIQYKNITDLPVRSSFLPETDTPIIVRSASLEDLTGDKLTAFAPNTTGIPYFRGSDSMSMEIIKQLFDLGNLFDKAEDIDTIKSTFKKFVKSELAYRNLDDLSYNDVLEDIYQTSLCIVTRGTDGNGNFNQLQQGIQRISGFIFSENYYLDKAITDASKTAYLSMLIKYNADSMEKFSDSAEIADWLIVAPMNPKLNKLKKTNLQAFFYWYKISKLI